MSIETTELDLQSEQQFRDYEQNVRIASGLLIALAAEGERMSTTRNFCINALNLKQDDVTAAALGFSVPGGRLRSDGPMGLKPAAGAFPMTAEEYRIQTEIVRPVIAITAAGKQLRGELLEDQTINPAS